MEEYFDLVDANNKPLGKTKKRSEVHRDGDWHRSVHVYIFNSDGDFLVHLRSPKKDMHPNQWDLRFGGHVIAGETYESTVLAELKQEIGITANPEDFRIVGVFPHDGGVNKEHVRVYAHTYDSPISHLHFNDNEVVKVRWMSPSQIRKAIKENPEEWVTGLQGFERIVEMLK